MIDLDWEDAWLPVQSCTNRTPRVSALDELLGPPGSPAGSSWLEMRIDELKTKLQPHTFGGWLNNVNLIVGAPIIESDVAEASSATDGGPEANRMD